MDSKINIIVFSMARGEITEEQGMKEITELIHQAVQNLKESKRLNSQGGITFKGREKVMQDIEKMEMKDETEDEEEEDIEE